MFIWSILLRILLTAGLILNGSGYAAAAVQVEAEHRNGHSMAASAEAADPAAPPCHEHVRADAVKAMMAASAVVDVAGAQVSGVSSPQCCEGSVECGCACAQQAAGVVVALAHGHAVIGRERSARASEVDHASPTLPHLIRPPIG